MAHKDGKRDVWLNIEVLSKILSISIEYDRKGKKIKSSKDLWRTKFISGRFDSSKNNAFAGQQFSARKKAINGSQLSSEISDYYTVKYDFADSLQDVEALYINDNSRDFSSLSVFFTDYEPSTIVHPKMSQPGMSSRLNDYGH